MKPAILLSIMSALWSCASFAADIDPVVVSPDMYTVLLENDHVRVVRYVIQPGERDNWHTHPPKVSYVASGGKLRITIDGGESFEVTEETGHTSWMSALGRHFAENIGDTPVSVILVEVKSVGVRAGL